LETDPTLSQFVGRFVPLKVTSTGKEWQQWASKYKKEGKTIPIIYVVRADGEQLYGKSGSLKGDALLKLLTTASEQSGRILNEAEFNLLSNCNLEASSAIAKGDYVAAAVALKPVSQMGVLGDLQCYAEAALKADMLATQIGSNVTSILNMEVADKLKNPKKVFDGVLELAKAEQVFYDFPGVKPATDQLIKELKKDKTNRAYLKPATALVKARVVAMSPKPYDKKRAEKAYGNIISRFGESPAAEIARQELKVLNPESERLDEGFVATDGEAAEETESNSDDDLVAESAEPEVIDKAYRDWGSANGKYSIKAKLIETGDEFVVLKKPNGSTVNVPLEKLDQASKDFLKNQDQ
jgi:hypothetical protein